MSSIAIVGAGPQLGLAVARTFGSHGFDVALISRNRAKLDSLVGKLTDEGITAAAFPADVLDRGAPASGSPSESEQAMRGPPSGQARSAVARGAHR